MLTKDDLNKIQLLITDGLKPVTVDINGLKKDVNGVKIDISEVKKDLNGVKEDIGAVKREVDGVKKDIKGVKIDMGVVKREVDGLKDEIVDVKESIALLPTKSEYFNSMDKLMGEIKKVREEQEVIGDTLLQHNDRLERVEEKVGISPPC